tara:strand:- start:487 stop:864 length:378 start_codon:yes stop_codon:yes gene_type:complete
MKIAILLNILVPILSLIGGIILWHGVIEGMESYHLIWCFLIYIAATVPTTMFAEHIKDKYEIPNKTKTISFNGKKFKKNTFDSLNELPTKGIVAGVIIALAAVVPFLIWFFFTEFLPAILSGPNY